jgi:hypothetical protein
MQNGSNRLQQKDQRVSTCTHLLFNLIPPTSLSTELESIVILAAADHYLDSHGFLSYSPRTSLLLLLPQVPRVLSRVGITEPR